MAEGILTASIADSGGVSFQTTAGSIQVSAKSTQSKTFTFSYTPSFIICFVSDIQMGMNNCTSTSNGWQVAASTDNVSSILVVASGGTGTIYTTTGSWAFTITIALSSNTATLKNVGNGSYYSGARVAVYGAL